MPLSRAQLHPADQGRTPLRPLAVLVPLATLALASMPVHAADTDKVTVAERFHQSNPAARIETGGWRLRPLAELRAGYNDNVQWRASGDNGSPELALRGSLEANRESGIAEWNLRGSFATTRYAEGDIRSAMNASASVGLVLRLSPLAELQAAAGYDQVREPVSANGIEIDGAWVNYRDFPDVERIPLSLNLTVRHGRFSLEVAGTSLRSSFDDLVTTTGLTVSQDFRSGWENELRTRATWSAHEALEAFVEAELGFERYDNTAANADSYSIAIGTLFEPHPLLRAQLLAGFAHQDYPIADGASGLVFEGQLTWYMSPLVTVTLDAARAFRGNVVTDTSGTFSTEPATSDRIGLAADWEPLRRLLVSLQAAWIVDETESGNRRDTAFSVGLKAHYAVTNRLHGHIGIEHWSGQSSIIGDVSRNWISVGLSTPY